MSIIPNTTGAARAIGQVMPELKGKLDGISLRVPVPAGSITDLVATLKTEASVQQINDALRAVINEGLGVSQIAMPLAFLAIWGIVCFAIAVRIFRWQ